MLIGRHWLEEVYADIRKGEPPMREAWSSTAEHRRLVALVSGFHLAPGNAKSVASALRMRTLSMTPPFISTTSNS